jgi:chromosome segregation ATPase
MEYCSCPDYRQEDQTGTCIQCGLPQDPLKGKAVGAVFDDMSELQDELEQTAEQIAQFEQNTHHWAGWLRYLIKQLERLSDDPEGFEATLERLKADLETRLERGDW